MQESSFTYSGEELDVMVAAKNYHKWVVGLFQPYLKGNVIEVGAGIGTVSRYIIPFCDHLTAIEPDAGNYAKLSAINDYPDKLQTFRGMFADYVHTPGKADRVDAILYINVLEHIQDDGAELLMAKDLVAEDNGYLCIFVPAIKKLYGDIDRQVGHFRRYSKSELRNLIENRLDMEIVRLGYFDFAGVMPWYIFSCLLKKNNPTPGSVKLYDRLVVPIMSRLERLFPLPWGKNLYIIARKKQ